MAKTLETTYTANNSFDVKTGRKTKSYKAGDTFVPGEEWVEIPRNPGDNENAIKFSVPYEVESDSKEPVINHRTVILPLTKTVTEK